MEMETVTNAAKGITDYGALAMMAAAYLSISLLMMVAIFKWFKSIINNILQNNSQDMKDYGLFDKKDLLSDCFGAVTGATLGI